MCMVDDADGWEFYAEKDRRARKPHKCFECDRTIQPGEQYRHAVGVMDGQMQVYKHCAHCLAAAQWLVVACRGFLFGGVLEDLREHWGYEWDDDDEETESHPLRTPMLRSLIDGLAGRWGGGSDPVPDVEAVRASVPVGARA